MLALYVALSIAGVAAGGLAALAARNVPIALAGLKGLAAGAVGVLVFFDIMPEVIEESGAAGLGVAVAAFVALHLVERAGGKRDHDEPHGRFGAAELVLMALVVHSALDGVGLAVAAATGGATGASVAAAVVGHQLPVSAVLMWTFLRRRSVAGAVARLGILAASVALGAAGGDAVLRLFAPIEPYALAFASGTLLHVLGHDFAGHHAHRPADRVVEAATFVLAAAATFLVPEVSPWEECAAPAAREFTEAAAALLAAAAPYYLLGILAAGALRASSRERDGAVGMRAAVRAGTLCPCGRGPGRLSAPGGAPPADAVAFPVVASGLGLGSLALGVGLLGWRLMLAHSVLVLAAAGLLGLLAGALARRTVTTPDRPGDGDSSAAAPPRASRLREFVFGVVGAADRSGPWLVLGLLVAAATLLILPADAGARWAPPWDVLAAAAAAAPLYVCTPAAAPLAAALLAVGVSPGAAIAILFLGPSVSATQIRGLAGRIGAVPAVAVACGAVALAVAAGLAVNALDIPHASPAGRGVGSVHVFEWVCGGAVVAIFVAAFFRVGPLHWIAAVGGVVPSGSEATDWCECEALGEAGDGDGNGAGKAT